MRKILIVFMLGLTFVSVYSQDVITKKSGEDIKAKILEVNTTEVKFKKFDYQTGPTYTLLISDILIIRYENGTKDIFQNENAISSPAKGKDLKISYKNKTYIYIAPSIPLGNFVENGDAKLGASIGYENITQLAKSIYFTGNVNLTYNSGEYGSSAWGYLMDWTTLGLRYQTSIDNFEFYGLGLAGFNWTVLTGDLNKLDSGFAFAYGLGAGVIMNKRLNLGLRFFGSNPKFKYSTNNIIYTYDPSISLLQIALGIEF